MDFIDLIVDSSDEFLTGYYYNKRPVRADDERVTFSYKQLNSNSRIFDTVLGNIRLDKATYAISTNDDCDFKVGAYIKTQNGLVWEIVEVVKNEETKTNKDVLRWFAKSVDSETNVRMIEVDDLFAKVDTYSKYCKVSIVFNYLVDETTISVKESLSKKELSFKKNVGVETSSITFETNRNTALTIKFNLPAPNASVAKTMQIPSYKTLEASAEFKYNA